jgi:hypothetical protein
LMAPQIKHNWEIIHPAPQYLFQTSLSEWFGIIYLGLPGMKPTYCPSGSGYFPLICHTQQLGTTRLFNTHLMTNCWWPLK